MKKFLAFSCCFLLGLSQASAGINNPTGGGTSFTPGGDLGGGPTSQQVLSAGNNGTNANYIQFLGATAGNAPSISAVGSDTNINLTLSAKGTGLVQTNSGFNAMTTVAASSGTQSQISSSLEMTGNYWTGTVSSPATAVLSYQPPVYSNVIGRVTLTMPLAGNQTGGGGSELNEFRVTGVNGAVSAYNTNDTLGAALFETYNVAWFGWVNSSNVIQGAFAIQPSSGKVGSTVPANASPSFRNVLDDGTGKSTYTGTVSVPQLIGNSSAPTIAAGTGAGTSPTVTVTGTTLAGVVNVTTGTTPAATATVATISFAATLATAPQGCTLMPRNATTALAAAMIYTTAPTTTAWTVAVGGTALTASTAYSWSYSCF